MFMLLRHSRKWCLAKKSLLISDSLLNAKKIMKRVWLFSVLAALGFDSSRTANVLQHCFNEVNILALAVLQHHPCWKSWLRFLTQKRKNEIDNVVCLNPLEITIVRTVIIQKSPRVT